MSNRKTNKLPPFGHPQDRNLPSIQKALHGGLAAPRGQVWKDFNGNPAVGGYDEKTGERSGAYSKGPADKRK